MALQVYGIPNCGTCKKAFQWLATNGIEYEFINTKEQPPEKSQIEGWVKELGAKPMRNTSGQSYRALGPERDSWSDEEWVKAFTHDAMLLKRPLFVKDGTAVLVGFKDKDDVLRQSLRLS
ncbi:MULTISPECIES: Spx/MgsR family RNA polymerase-binding regulatory protein [unclassified Leptolyngbya]|uniref:Spx/MgsR family RNA polymerase-binding regulatory protein n=1 Tax=unclassified Leptolyngbya TaxID=2650499 RepID=UPI00168268DE|nr:MULTISPECIES: Spx/MgsR family RNA polymerase-binding regulatory protein [unclassified Leptolyngbya]MBD1910125.1 Spx/MgsR family RNA polymerase-binding regulatory protein [Leptolyngbya sp. FACHB-8]MBD2156897.1 Spx/MgsR family RNA polymerase-binding regulatory protein [Leptolyngbya sp. FACHB-16]